MDAPAFFHIREEATASDHRNVRNRRISGSRAASRSRHHANAAGRQANNCGRRGWHLHRTIGHEKAPARGRAFLFCFEWFMVFAYIRDSMMIPGSRRHRDRCTRECDGMNRERRRIIAGMSRRTKEHRRTRAASAPNAGNRESTPPPDDAARESARQGSLWFPTPYKFLKSPLAQFSKCVATGLIAP